MLKPVLLLSLITLSGCSVLREPPKHGTPDAVYSTKSDTESVSFCITNAFSYDPFIPVSYERTVWGYKVGYDQEIYGEAEVYKKDGITIVNYFHKNNSNQKMVKYVKDGIQKCVTMAYDMSPVGGVQPDGTVKLW